MNYFLVILPVVSYYKDTIIIADNTIVLQNNIACIMIIVFDNFGNKLLV